MVGCPERRLPGQLAVGQGTAGGRVDTRRRQGLVVRERREQPRQTLGQHRLPRPWRLRPPAGPGAGPARPTGRAGRECGRHRSPAGWAARSPGPAGRPPVGPAWPPARRRHGPGRPPGRHTAGRPSPTGVPHRQGRSCPGMWRSEPFSPSSEKKERPSVQSELNSPAATSGRPRPWGGRGRRHLCARRTVPDSRPFSEGVNGSPLDRMAARTRSRDSRTAASGSPTMVNPGSPLDTCTPTETALAVAPVRTAERTAACCTG